MSNHAECAKMIRRDLKHSFPHIKFKVISERYSGGSSVSISWENGPNRDNVNAIVHKYQYGRFDAQTDYYDIDNSRNDIPQVQYVQCSREVSEYIKEEVFKWLQRTHLHFDQVMSIDETNHKLMECWNVWTARNYISRVLANMNLSHGFLEPQEALA